MKVVGGILLIGCVFQAFAQTRNPLAGDANAVANGEKLYATRCAACHGNDARGGEGPNLYRSRMVVTGPDGRFFEALKRGIPGTEMAPINLPDDQLWQIVSFVHSQAKPGQGPPVPGDQEAGRKVFADAGCVRCHMVEGKGGVLGPDLSSIALQLSAPRIREAVLNPSANIAEGFKTITVTTKSGQRLEAALKNEDNFSVQLMSESGDLVALPRDEIVSIDAPKGSLMPAGIATNLSSDQLQNLLAFLDRRRAPFTRFQMSFQNY